MWKFSKRSGHTKQSVQLIHGLGYMHQNDHLNVHQNILGKLALRYFLDLSLCVNSAQKSTPKRLREREGVSSMLCRGYPTECRTL